MNIRLPVLLLLLLVAACSPPPAPPPYGSGEPLDANDLPAKYTLCARNRAVTSAAIYDVFYECRKELVWYVVELGGMDQQAKAILLGELDIRAMNYAHKEVIERHGEEAVRRTLKIGP